jgi:hypothetical protein
MKQRRANERAFTGRDSFGCTDCLFHSTSVTVIRYSEIQIRRAWNMALSKSFRNQSCRIIFDLKAFMAFLDELKKLNANEEPKKGDI